MKEISFSNQWPDIKLSKLKCTSNELKPKYEHTIKDRYWKYLIPTAANRIKNERRSELL